MSTGRRFVVLCLSVATLSCTAYRLPPQREVALHPRIESFGHAAIGRSRLPSYLADDQADEFLTRLRDDLIATGLFASVAVGDAPGPETVVVEAEYSGRHCFAEPLITVVTLGIVPYPGCYYSGYRLTLQSDRFDHDLLVDDRSAPLALWGWIAGPIALLPGWSSTLPVERERVELRSAIEQAIAAAQGSGD